MTAPSRPIPRVGGTDVLRDATRTVRARLGRSIGLGLAVALGVATLVAILSLSLSADVRAQQRIDAQRPELVRIRPVLPSTSLEAQLPRDAIARVTTAPSVLRAAIVQTLAEVPVRGRLGGTDADQLRPAPLVAVAGDVTGTTRTALSGRTFHPAEVARHAHVALVGGRLADRLGLADVRAEPVVWVDGIAFRVIGITGDSQHLSALGDAVVIPRSTVVAVFGDTHLQVDTAIYLRTRRGAASVVAGSSPLRLTPERPEQWDVEVPQVSIALAEGISADLRRLGLAVGALSLVVGIVAIGNAMLRSIYERLPEIGLRRSLGARAAHIVGMLLVEAALIGLLAGVVGAATGAAVAVGVATVAGWPVVVSAPGAAAALPVAIGAGCLGGLVPAWGGVRITPSQALRRE